MNSVLLSDDVLSQAPHPHQPFVGVLCADLFMLLWQDRGESSYDPVYEKVLGGLSLVARHAAMPLLDALLAWRKDAESQAQHAGSELVVLRKKVTRVFPIVSLLIDAVSPCKHVCMMHEDQHRKTNITCACSWQWRPCFLKLQISWLAWAVVACQKDRQRLLSGLLLTGPSTQKHMLTRSSVTSQEHGKR